MNYYCPFWLRSVRLWRLQTAYLSNYLLNEKLNELCPSWVQLSPDQFALWSPAKVISHCLASSGKKTLKGQELAFPLHFCSSLGCSVVSIKWTEYTRPLQKCSAVSFPSVSPSFAKDLESGSEYQRAFLATSAGSFFRWYTKFCRSAWNQNACKEKKIKIDFKGQLWHGQLIIKTVF